MASVPSPPPWQMSVPGYRTNWTTVMRLSGGRRHPGRCGFTRASSTSGGPRCGRPERDRLPALPPSPGLGAWHPSGIPMRRLGRPAQSLTVGE